MILGWWSRFVGLDRAYELGQQVGLLRGYRLGVRHARHLAELRAEADRPRLSVVRDEESA